MGEPTVPPENRWAHRRCPKCQRVAYVPAGAFCTFHANRRYRMEDTRA